jgi:hypothetical protein
MNFKTIVSVTGVAVLGFVASQVLAQEEDDLSAATRTPTPPIVRYKYAEASDPLKMLEEIRAANEALLAKQRDCLARLDELAQTAQADKAAAHRSTSRGKK